MDRARGARVSFSEMKARAGGHAAAGKRTSRDARKCFRPAHTAAPAGFAVWELSLLKARALPLRMDHGPWAARYYAARLFAQQWEYLPRNWDWTAQVLTISAPPSFDGVFRSACAKSTAVSLASKQVDRVPNTKVSVRLNVGVSQLGKVFLSRQRRPGRGMSSHSLTPSTDYGESTLRSYSGDKGATGCLQTP